MRGIKKIIGVVLMIVGMALCCYYIFGPTDKQTLTRQADYGGTTSPSARSQLYLFVGMACGFVGGTLVRRS